MNNKITLTESDLIYFTGTENYYRHPLIRKVFHTDGIKYVADAGNARCATERNGNPLSRKSFS